MRAPGPHPHTVCGWRQNLQALTPDTLLSFCSTDDCITVPVTMKVGGNMARSWILLTQSSSLMAVRSKGMSSVSVRYQVVVAELPRGSMPS